MVSQDFIAVEDLQREGPNETHSQSPTSSPGQPMPVGKWLCMPGQGPPCTGTAASVNCNKSMKRSIYCCCHPSKEPGLSAYRHPLWHRMGVSGLWPRLLAWARGLQAQEISCPSQLAWINSHLVARGHSSPQVTGGGDGAHATGKEQEANLSPQHHPQQDGQRQQVGMGEGVACAKGMQARGKERVGGTYILAVSAVILILGLYVNGELRQERALQKEHRPSALAQPGCPTKDQGLGGPGAASSPDWLPSPRH